MNRLETYYHQSVVPNLIRQQNYTNYNQIPKLEQITLNLSFKTNKFNLNTLPPAMLALYLITGQLPV